MSEISTEEKAHSQRCSSTHKRRYTRTPHSKGGYYKDSDVPHVSPLPCVIGGPTSARHLIRLRLTSRQPHQGGCHLIQKRGVALSGRLLPPLLGGRARELTRGKGRQVINLKRQRREERGGRGKQKGERNEGDGRGESEGRRHMQRNDGCRGEGAHQPSLFHPSTTAASFNLRRQKIDWAIYLCTDLGRTDEQTCKPRSEVSFLSRQLSSEVGDWKSCSSICSLTPRCRFNKQSGHSVESSWFQNHDPADRKMMTPDGDQAVPTKRGQFKISVHFQNLFCR